MKWVMGHGSWVWTPVRSHLWHAVLLSKPDFNQKYKCGNVLYSRMHHKTGGHLDAIWLPHKWIWHVFIVLKSLDISAKCTTISLWLGTCNEYHNLTVTAKCTLVKVKLLLIILSPSQLRPNRLGLKDSLNSFIIFIQPPYSSATCLASGRLCLFT